jgi:uncharacterized repeat protein (TIGR01451 family)
MSSRCFWRMVILVLFLSGTPVVPASAQDTQPLILARVNLGGPWTEIGLPVYAELQDASGQAYTLVLASAGRLAASGQPYQVLDGQVSGVTYLIARNRRSSRSLAELRQIQEHGFALLHDDGRQWVLRARSGDADRLASLGFDVQFLGSTPMVLRRPTTPAAPASITPDPVVAQMIAHVTQTAVYNLAADLSGMRPVTVGGVPYTLGTRNTRQITSIQAATQYAYERMQGLGLQVSYHTWTANGLSNRNVIGEKPGAVHPDEIVLIVGHLDDMPNATVAPGADDNASGSAGVLLAAEILSHYQFERTLRFVLFTGEEQGLLGSNAYASLVSTQNITAVYNMDMIAWDNLGGPVLELHTRTSTNPGYATDLQIANLFINVVSAYGLAATLTPVIVADGESASDHSSFWSRGFSAILGIEDTANDFNPYYHTVDDTLSRLNLAYFTNFVKAAVGTAAHLAYPMGPIFAISKRVTPAVPLAGDRLTYTLFVTNTGAAATEVVVQDHVPPQTTFAAASDGGVYQAGEVTWQNLTLSSNSSLALTLAVTVSCMLTNTIILNDDYHVSLGLAGTQTAGPAASVIARPALPIAAFTYPQPALARRPVTFTNASQHTYAYLWAFGDGSTSTAAEPSHTYVQPGVYTVSLMAANACAGTTTWLSLRVDDYAVAANPAVSGLRAPPGVTVTHTVVFTNTGTLPETYQITADAHQWPTVLSATAIGPLAPDSVAPVEVRVTVPTGTIAGSTDEVAVKATAIHDPRQPAAAAAGALATTADATYGVQVTPPLANQSGDPGGIVQYTLNVQNRGNATDSFALNLGSHTWTTDAVPKVGPLAPGVSAKTYISVSVPAGALPGANDSVTVTLASQADPARATTSRLTTTARAFYNLQVRPSVQEGWGNQGAIVTYGLRITNTGNILDTYYLAAAGQKWPAVPVVTAIGPLLPGTGADFAVRVKLPDTLDGGITDTAIVTAASQVAPARYAGAQLVTHANVVYGLQLAPVAAEQTGAPGTIIQYALRVTNTGNLADRFAVTIPSHNWPAGASPAVVGPLAPGIGGNVLVDVTVPATAASGDQDVAVVKVASSGQPARSLTATLMTRAQHVYGVSLSPERQHGYGPAGHQVNYTLWIGNTGSLTDTFTVTVGSHTWPIGSLVSEVPLSARAGAAIGVSVFVPAEPMQPQDIMTVTAVSHAAPAHQAVATLTTIWLRPELWLPLVRR